jgi:hypothetical protein
MGSVMSQTRGMAPGARQKAEGHVAGAARHVQQRWPGARRQPVHHRVFPEPVDADRHHVVHHVVFAGDARKDAMHHPGLFGLGHGLKAEMRGSGRWI